MSMKPSLRVVQPGSAESIEMADAIQAAAEICKAARPVSAMVVWEVMTKEGSKIEYTSVPNSFCLKRGMADRLYELMWPKPEDVDD